MSPAPQTTQVTVSALDAAPQESSAAPVAKHTYVQILNSSALIGGSSAINILIGMVRTKAMAVLLGPTGVGVLGLYGSILDLAVSIAGMGVSSSGVRQIAEAVGTGDGARIARTVLVLRRVVVILGVLGAALLAASALPVSEITFGTGGYAAAVVILSLAVFFRVVADGQGALLQGMRRIGDLAKMGVVGTAFGAVISVTVVYAFGEQGIAPALAGGAAMTLAIAWWFSRQVSTEGALLTRPVVREEAASLLKLGLAFMASALLVMLAAYAVRAMVVRMIGFEAAGLYQAAWTLGGLYVGIILGAMGTDFYPRLVGVAANNAECNRIVNEQAHVSLLLAGPGVLATLTFAPLVLHLFYSAKFSGAVDLLRWICLGIALRVIAWPMGYIIVAKNSRILFFGADLAWTFVNVGLTWLCLRWYGLNGAGIAFFGSYVFHALMIYPIVRGLSGFRWSRANARTGLLFLVSIAAVFGAFFVLPTLGAVALGTVASVLSGLYAVRTLANLVATENIPRPLLRLFESVGLLR